MEVINYTLESIWGGKGVGGMERKRTGVGVFHGNSFYRTEGKAGGSQRVPGGFSICTGAVAYIQGYVDCVQALEHMGLLRENGDLKWDGKIEILS